MPTAISSAKYGPEVQRVPVNAPIEDVIMLLKRDGGVIVEGFLPPSSIDQTYEEIRPKMENDREWKGNFFPVSIPFGPSSMDANKRY